MIPLAAPLLAAGLAAAGVPQTPEWEVVEPPVEAGAEHLSPGEATAARLAQALATQGAGGGFPEIEAVLFAAVVHDPQRARLYRVGRSPGGRPLYLLEIGAREERARTARPAFLVTPDLGADPRRGTAAAMAVVEQLLRDAEGEGQLLERATWYTLPAPLPDRLGTGTPGPGEDGGPLPTDPDRNFPVGWDPWSDSPPGPYPLSEPATATLADLLTHTPGLAALLLVGGEPADPARYALPGVDPGDLGVQRDLGRRDGSRAPAGEAGPIPGGLREFAFGHAGIFVVEGVQHGGLEDGGLEDGGLEDGGLEDGGLKTCLGALPELVLVPRRVERLCADLYRVEVEVGNHGRLPTESGAAASRRAGGQLTLSVEGPTVRAICVEVGGGTFEVRGRSGAPLPLGALGPGQERTLRLVVEGRPGQRLTLVAAAPRAGTTRLDLELP